MNKITKDLSILTTIPEKNLDRLVDLSKECIYDAIEESRLKEESICEIDLGIGILYILLSKETTKYKFIPSEDLEININKVIRKDTSPMTKFVETTIVDKIINTYKDLM